MLNSVTGIEEGLKKDGIIISGFSGISMRPLLRSGKDRVVIEPVKEPLKLHDVPLYRSKSGKYVLHRIIKISDNGYVIRGDNLYRNEYNVTDSDIVGVLKAFYRGRRLYSCEKNKAYNLYILYVRLSYPLRYVIFGKAIPFLKRIKRFLKKTVK